MENSEDLIDIFAAILAQRIINRIYEKSIPQCDCEYCCPKPSPQLDIPDCADLVNELLSEAGVKKLIPISITPLPSTVTIFKGPFAGGFGVIYPAQCCLCSCCVYVQTTSGVVKVSRMHCNIHA